MEIKKHTCTEQEAYQKLSALCASAEYCEADLRKKMRNWAIIPQASSHESASTDEPDAEYEREDGDTTSLDSIISRLRQERFIDDSRYAHAFVRDKFRYNHWGRVRISQELKMRKISADIIEDALCEIPEEDNLDTLRRLIDTKRKSVKGKSEYEIRGKLIRFALGRGFQMDDIIKVVGEADFE